MIVEIVTSFTTHILVLENHVPCHLLDGFGIGEASRVSGKAKFALESLSCMLLLHMPYSLSLNNLHNYRLGWLSRWPSHFTKEWLNGFSASWESSICERKLHYPGNRTQDLLLTGEIWQPL